MKRAKDMGVEELVKENRKLKEEIENHKQNIMQDELEIIPKLEKEIKSLKAKLKKREQGKYRYFGNDGESDLYEDVGGDELIYEEGLYD